MRLGPALLLPLIAITAAGCPPAVTDPAYVPRGPVGDPPPDPTGDPIGGPLADPPPRAPAPLAGAPHEIGKLDNRMVDFEFQGGRIELELYRAGDQIEQVVRNRYAVPVTLHWQIESIENLTPESAMSGVVVLPAARAPMADGAPVVIAQLRRRDAHARYRRELYFKAFFGDPQARPTDYVYALPYPRGKTFSVLQGFHGKFSHTGANEFAVDFDCPVATTVRAARPGVVVAVNAAAQGSGTTPDYFENSRVNFVLVLHDDGTLGEYMHLAPSGAQVHPGERVVRGQDIALSGNTGFSSTPHLHFQVMTASEDGPTKRSFPFRLATARGQAAGPTLGQHYTAWE